jgi:hypothetical protein
MGESKYTTVMTGLLASIAIDATVLPDDADFPGPHAFIAHGCRQAD